VSEHTQLFQAIETLPFVRRKANWALRLCNTASSTFSDRLIAFMTVEGIFFSGTFYTIFWLNKQRVILPDLCF
jgi:ribonucleoside-diphosphate reductase subunit M2